MSATGSSNRFVRTQAAKRFVEAEGSFIFPSSACTSFTTWLPTAAFQVVPVCSAQAAAKSSTSTESEKGSSCPSLRALAQKALKKRFRAAR